MMRYLAIATLLLVCAFPSLGQRVVDASFLGKDIPFRYFPDVEGKVLVDESYYGYLTAHGPREDITVFPGWPVTVTGSNERGGIFANLDADPELELVYTAGAFLYAFQINGINESGWPRPLDFPTDGAAAFGDIDGDGEGEIVVTTHQIGTFAFGTIYAFEKDGDDVDGFPIATEGGAVRTPVLADLDGDGALEIIVAIRAWPDGFIYVFRGDGTVYPNWPVRMDYVPGSAVAVGDITGDETPEIVAESYYFLHAYTTEAALLTGFPFSPGISRVFSYSSPVLADLDGDGMREIICGDHSIEDGTGAVHIVKNDGTELQGWPKMTTNWIYGPPSIGDIDGDGELDIAVGDQTLSANPVNIVYAWNALSGYPLPGFPIEDIFAVNNQVILADLDGDDKIELMFDDNTSAGKYLGYNHDGTAMDNRPLYVDGTTFFINPLVADISQDGTLAISGGGYDEGSDNLHLYLWNANAEYNAALAVLPILQYNTRHNGVFGDYLMVGMKEGPGEGPGEWQIFPNPTNEILNFKFSILNSGRDLFLSIYDISGREVMKRMVPRGQKELQINIRDYKEGIYIAVMKDGSSTSASWKFVISHFK